MDYKELCFQVQKLPFPWVNLFVNERSKISENDVELKSAASLVTYVDKTAEATIVSALKKINPGKWICG